VGSLLDMWRVGRALLTMAEECLMFFGQGLLLLLYDC